MLLSLNQISYKKNIQTIIQKLPQIIKKLPQTHLIIIKNNPYLKNLKKLTKKLKINKYIQFTNKIPNKKITIYYKTTNYFINTSTSKTQNLTYTKTITTNIQYITKKNTYLNNLFNHKNLNKTFKTNNNFTPTLINYIQTNIKINQTILNKKLFKISSTNFNNKIIKFYQNTLIYFNQLQIKKKNTNSIKKIKIKFTSLKK